MMRVIRDALAPIGFMLIIAGLILIVRMLTGCDSAATQVQRAKNAIDVAAYDHELADCRAEGKDAGSFWVYERCAQEVDRKYGVDGGAP